MEPRHIHTDNCLVYYHGGGFFFEGAGYHYCNAKAYALNAPCKVVFVQYRLAPKHPFPIPAEDSFEALKWADSNAENLGIDRSKIAVGGDSAGGCLAAAVTQMVRDRGLDIVQKAPTTKAAVAKRIEYLKRMFGSKSMLGRHLMQCQRE